MILCECGEPAVFELSQVCVDDNQRSYGGNLIIYRCADCAAELVKGGAYLIDYKIGEV